MQTKHQFTEYADCFLFSLSVLLPCLLVTAATDYAPINQVVVSGRNATLQCGSDSKDSLQWKYKQAGEEEILLITSQNMLSINARIMLNTSIDGQYDLHISNVERTDAGIYTCVTTTNNSTAGSGSSGTKRYEAQLTILTSDPICTLNTNRSNNILVENDFVRMQCYVRFLGDLVPVVNWRREGQLIDGAETNFTKPRGAMQFIVMSSIFVQVSPRDNGVIFTCDTLFTTNVHSNSSDEYSIKATNNPDYKYTWTSPPINVSYGPQNLTIQSNNNISSNDASITLGDRLKCFADGNPIPRYEWTIFAEHTNITLNSSEFVLNASMLNNFRLTAECKAVNDFGERTKRFARNVSVAGDTCTTEQSRNQENSSTMQTYNSDKAIVLMVLVMAGILSVLILLVIGRRRICKSNKGNSEDRVEIENGGPIYSVLGDHIARSTSSPRIASVVLYQDGQVDTGKTDNCKVGLSPNYLEVIYEDINSHESDLVVNGGGYDDIMHYASTEQSKHNGDLLYTKGLNPNLTKQEQSKPKQTVGADGTIYTEVNKNEGSAELYSSVKKQSQSMKFPKSTYATIDHSVKTLPPPPKLPR